MCEYVCVCGRESINVYIYIHAHQHANTHTNKQIDSDGCCLSPDPLYSNNITEALSSSSVALHKFRTSLRV